MHVIFVEAGGAVGKIVRESLGIGHTRDISITRSHSRFFRCFLANPKARLEGGRVPLRVRTRLYWKMIENRVGGADLVHDSTRIVRGVRPPSIGQYLAAMLCSLIPRT